MGFRIAQEAGLIAGAAGLMAPARTIESAKQHIVLGPEILMPSLDFECPDDKSITLLSELSDILHLPADGRTPQFVSAKYVNRHAPDELLVVANGYNGNITSIDDSIRLFTLGRLFPTHPILMMDHFGHGGSSKFTATQRKEWQNGKLDSVTQSRVESFLGFIATHRNHDSHYTEIGISAGNIEGMARHIALLESGETTPTSHIAVETPSTKLVSTAEVNKGFMLYEGLIGLNLRAYDGGDWLWKYKSDFTKAFSTYGGYREHHTASSFASHDKRMFMANLRKNVVNGGIVKRMLDQILETGIPFAKISSYESRVDNAHDAATEHRRYLENGSSFDLLAIVGVSHEVVGYLGFSIPIFSAVKRLYDRQQDQAYEPKIEIQDLSGLIAQSAL